ncbi:VOC family protein [Nonomuraea sp. NPDC050310]|uniref:VOC family protein n=1 Tax=unclassified Nonomuraea TaxID=2593643 RepID=UPI0033D6DFED
MNKISAIVIDCASPTELAGFYQKVLGGEIGYSDADFASLQGGPVTLSFQRVPGYSPPAWPGEAGKHAHLDLAVEDVERTVKELQELGATLPEHQPGDGNWTVVRDPEGHLFCLSAA